MAVAVDVAVFVCDEVGVAEALLLAVVVEVAVPVPVAVADWVPVGVRVGVACTAMRLNQERQHTNSDPLQ